MHAILRLATTRVQSGTLTLLAVFALLLVIASTLACANRGCKRDDYRGTGCRAEAARESLAFGLSREAAIDAIGRSEVEPPWKNDLGLGPAVITNPFDSETMTSPIGEEYEIVRFYVEATGNPDCPFVQGNLRFEPLIFVDDQLVGWRWSYLADVLGTRISTKAKRWNFGAFCDSRRGSSPKTDSSESPTPNVDPATPNVDPAAPNAEPATPNAEPATPNVDPAAPNVDPATPNVDPPASD